MATREASQLASAHHRRGLAYAQHRQLDQAIRAFAHAIEINPGFAFAYIDRGVAHAQCGEFRQALADLNRGLALSPNHPAALLARGLVHAELKSLDAALTDLTAARHADPDDADICFQRGHVYLARQDFTAAIADFTDAVRLDPDNARSHNQLAWLWSTHPDARFRNGRNALEHALKASELSGWQDAVILDTLAAAYAECRKFDEAIRWVEQAQQAANDELRAVMHDRLKLYQAGQPCRDGRII